ncbi:MAG TPA: glycosyltransferase [Vicinamibacterales bacterium]|nr:glycosyltransferase [Vicinamibacterales bacterium]
MPDTARLPIAFVMSSFEPGGTERQMMELVRRIDRSRWDVHVACLRTGGRWFDRVASVAFCKTFPISSFRHVSTFDRLRDFAHWCSDTRVAVVHACDTPSNIFGLTGAALARVPVRIGTRRDVNPGRSTTELALQRAAYSCAHLVVANARAAAERLRFERVPAGKIVVVPNGLDTSRVSTRARLAPLRRVVTVANLRPEKGHDVLVEAAADVVRVFPDATFALAGDGPERARLERLVRDRGLAGAFTFHGHVENVSAHLDAADIFVLPSTSEAFPNSLLEAMAAGLPVVASDVGGVPEMVSDGQTGHLVPPGDSRALATRLLTLMREPDEALRMGDAGRSAVVSRFSFDRMVAAFERVYVAELARKGVAAALTGELAVS